MAVKRVSPKEASELVAQGYAYLDVRSIPEYDGGHPPGAYNVPLMHMGPGGMAPNGDFAAVVARAFPDKSAKIVVGCKSGGRSIKAAEMMAASGYSNLVEMRGGYGGDGQEAGWAQVGLPSERATPGRSFEELKK